MGKKKKVFQNGGKGEGGEEWENDDRVDMLAGPGKREVPKHSKAKKKGSHDGGRHE